MGLEEILLISVEFSDFFIASGPLDMGCQSVSSASHMRHDCVRI